MHYQKPSFSCLIHPALIMLLIVTSVSVIAQAAQQETDGDSSAVFELVDTPYGLVMAASDIPVTLRDDVVLSLDIYLPESGERFSTLYAAGPYPHNQTILTDPNAEAGPIAWFASQGYAVVLASLRGTGLSGGDYGFLALEEQQDHYEIVEWIAGQPWSDGQVAGTGAGYYAAAQWQMAIQNPPHLSCIAPINGVTDPLREWVYPGGLANHEFINDWYDRRVRLANAYSQEAPRLVSLDLRLSQLANPGAGEFWQIRSSMGLINQIDVPVFVLFNWSQRLQQPSLALTIDALEQLNVTSKILITNPPENASLQQDIPLLATELLPFYEWCFNERSPDASFVERPRIRFQVRGQNATRPDSNWPPGNIEHKAWFLNPAGTDEYGALEQTRADSLAFTPMPAGNTDNTLRFISRRLTEDLELTGPVMLELYASTSGTDMAFKATLSEELIYQAITTTPLFPSFTTPDLPDNAMAEKSTLVTVTSGQLKASARARLAGSGSEFAPVYALQEKVTIPRGQATRMDIALKQTAYRFSAGNRLILELETVHDASITDSGNGQLIHHSAANPSRLWLPTVRTAASSRNTDRMRPSPSQDMRIPPTTPTFEFLDREALEEINGDPVENPVIFIPR